MAQINKETNELTIEREFNAPRQLVWDAWTKPELLEKWWGPKDWTTTVKKLELKEGSVWHYLMEGKMSPEATENTAAWGIGVFHEVNEPEKLIYMDSFSSEEGTIDESLPSALITVYFVENEGKTNLVTVSKYETIEQLEQVVAMGVEEGFNQSLDKLDEVLVKAK